MLNVIPVKAFTDNYIWLLVNTTSAECLIVDPGDAKPLKMALAQHALKPIAILVTHHHWDHVNGVAELLETYAMPVFGSHKSNFPFIDHPLMDQQGVTINNFPLQLHALEIPGHTLEHIAYYGEDLLFCGDTLFTGGCGRVFEGTIEQMAKSLDKLAALPDTTLVYCRHEYTVANLQFAKVVEPHNEEVQIRFKAAQSLRLENRPTVPSPLGLEKATNPFLRCHEASVLRAVAEYCGYMPKDTVEVFGILREWKNQFKL